MINDERLEALEARHASNPTWQWFNRTSNAYWGFVGRVADWFPKRIRLVRHGNPLLAIVNSTLVLILGFVVVTPLYLIVGPVVQVIIVLIAILWSTGAGIFGSVSPCGSRNPRAIQIDDFTSKALGRDIEEAEELFYELGDVFTNQWLLQPDKYGPRLKMASRADVRKGILIFIAKKKFQGIDILYRHELLPGRHCAVLELADNLWPFTSIVFGQFRDDMPVPEPVNESKTAGKRRDEFIDFLNILSPTDPDYWEKIRVQLSWTGLNTMPQSVLSATLRGGTS